MTDLEAIIESSTKHWYKRLGGCAYALMSRAATVYFTTDTIDVWVYDTVSEVKEIAKKYGLWSDNDWVMVGWDSFERVLRMMQEMDSL